jgi:tape measure domain-containing protein
VRGLAAYSRNAEELQAQLARLQEIAKLPGLGLKEVRQGVLQLEAAGISAQTSERALMAFGNALALVGRGKSELDGVILALGQIASKGAISAEEINQIAERVPQVRQALVTAFGTASTEAIQKMGLSANDAITKIISAMEQLPKATGGAITTFENLQDAIERAFLPIGRGILDIFGASSGGAERLIDQVGRLAQELGNVLTAIGNSGVIQETLDKLFNTLGGGGGFAEGFARLAANILAFFSDIVPTIQNATQAIKNSIVSGINELTIGVLENLSLIPFSGVTDTTINAAKGVGAASAALGQSKMQPVDMAATAERYFQQIMAAYGPQGLPAGLNFGGIKENAGTSSPVSSLLGQIANNTKTTAEALTLRRETLGGGQLGALGVTGAEMMGGNGGPFRFGDFFGGGNNGLIPAGTELERSVRRIMRDEARKNGTPGIMRRF